MKAIILKGFEGTDSLHTVELPVPEIGDTEVLVQVKAISVNPVDVKTAIGKGLSGRLKSEDPFILGWDISGIVTKKGSAVKEFEVGDAVFGMVNFPGHGKAYAEYVAAPANHLALKPANISHEEAAAATLAALTALQGLIHKANVRAGQKVLVHAAAGGVGHYVVQIAKHLGAYVIGTSSAANKDFVLGLGTDEHIDYKAVRFEEVVHDVDLVFDAIGGDNIDRSLEVAKKGGTVISIPSGISETITEKAKAKGINGYFFLVESNGDDMKQLAKWLEQGILKSHLSQVFPFDQMSVAHQQIASGRTRGKVVVAV
ncbi:NADP-dependent oxidoreductase [Mucilaginibacter sp. SG564]|uniref:NADP-dependent oxidoreductase n=1 Tax=Mucilaginibacter sp. SG564 TaxID=2587022 RepID=UPI001553EE81|nr:NADP-dependent oxidoreductase [Mucilaginibacter sp. SG564]NOW95140.1 NADPH:quinone reductase-like Zn-dependent oxidoreductase [Mucilaginibacter sp. SG564]